MNRACFVISVRACPPGRGERQYITDDGYIGECWALSSSPPCSCPTRLLQLEPLFPLPAQ